MKMFRCAALAALLLAAAPAFAQWQTPTYSVPIGQGLGITGFNYVAPGTAGLPLVSNGAAANPSYQSLKLTPLVNDSTNQTVTCNFYLAQHVATGPIAYTLPRANTCFSGFGFWVYALPSGGLVTLAPNAADNFDGAASGATVILNVGTWAFIYTDAASSGTWHLTGSQASAVVATDGTGCDRPSSTPRVASCRTITTSGYGHDFEAGSHITLSASTGEYGTYGDDTQISAPMGTTAPFYYNSFPTPTFSGPGTLGELGGYHWTPGVSGGTVGVVYGINIKDATVSGGGSITSQYGYFCPTLAAAALNRCLFIAGESDIRGHLHASGTAPTLSGCGTSPSVLGNDQAGVIVTGTGTPTSCTLTFVSSFLQTPSCVLAWASGPLANMQWVTNLTNIAITQTAANNTRIHYHCWDTL
jgi:hypothetical protein